MGWFDDVLTEEQKKNLKYGGMIVEDRYVKDLLTGILKTLQDHTKILEKLIKQDTAKSDEE